MRTMGASPRRMATSVAAKPDGNEAVVLDERRTALLQRTFMDYMPHSTFMKNPLVVSKAEGLYYWDVTGKRFFDGIGGIFTVSIGHGHPAVNEAVKRQLDQLTFAPPMHGVADVTFEFIEKLSAVTPPPPMWHHRPSPSLWHRGCGSRCRLTPPPLPPRQVTPGNLDYIKTYSGASEAMESAIKFVRQYWKQSGHPGKYKFISRYQSYHGATMGAMSASGTGMRKTREAPPACNVPNSPQPCFQ